jgi:hypothetical protein
MGRLFAAEEEEEEEEESAPLRVAAKRTGRREPV